MNANRDAPTMDGVNINAKAPARKLTIASKNRKTMIRIKTKSSERIFLKVKA
jgi:hypothetical protein